MTLRLEAKIEWFAVSNLSIFGLYFSHDFNVTLLFLFGVIPDGLAGAFELNQGQ